MAADGDRDPHDDLYLDLAFPEPPADRPTVYLGMVTSLDGGVTIDGTSRRLGGPGDALAFRRLRESCDAILVGAGTARIEDYGPPSPRPDARARRLAAGRTEVPLLAIVTASGRLDPKARAFRAPARRPIVITTTAADVDGLAAVADILRAGTDGVDLAAALRELRAGGVERLLVEGGPSLNRDLLAADLVDELFLTVAPTVVGDGRVQRGIVRGDLPAPIDFSVVSAVSVDGDVLLRYRRTG